MALALKKPKENHCFWLRTLKNLRKTFVFAFPRASGDPGGTIGPTTPKKYISKTPDPPPKRPLCYAPYEFTKLEADKTNVWLQKLHIAATTAVDKSEEAVQRVLYV